MYRIFLRTNDSTFNRKICTSTCDGNCEVNYIGCVFENIAIRKHQKIAAHLKQMILLEMTGASGTQTSFGCGLQLTTMDSTVLTQLVLSSSVTILLEVNRILSCSMSKNLLPLYLPHHVSLHCHCHSELCGLFGCPPDHLICYGHHHHLQCLLHVEQPYVLLACPSDCSLL